MSNINNELRGGQMGAGKTAPILESCLINKTVKIRPVPIKTGLIVRSHDNPEIAESNSIWLTGTSRSIICPLDGRTSRLINPLTEKERFFLEDILGVNLDVNQQKDNFLMDELCRIQVIKDMDDLSITYTELDLSNPIDYIKYKICQVSPLVALGKQKAYRGDQMFYIDDEVEEIIVEREDNKLEDECMKYLYSIEERLDKLYNFLRTFHFTYRTSKIVPKDAKIDWIYNEIKNLIKDRSQRAKVHELVTMVKKDEAAFETKILIQDALSIGELIYYPNASEYRLPDSAEAIGKSLKEVETFLKNPAQQMLKERIKNQIKLQLK